MRLGTLAIPLVLVTYAASARDEAKPIVTVNGEPIPREALAKILAPLKKANLPKARVNELAREYARQLVKDVLLSQFMRKEGYRPSEDEMDAEIARQRRAYEGGSPPDAPSFEEALRRLGTGVEEMRASPTAGMSFSCYVRSRMTERDLVRLFETERHAFDGSEVRARHILVQPKRMDGKSELARREMARQKAVEIRALALAALPDPRHEEFAKLAGEYSHCTTAANGGDLGFFTRFGFMPEEFSKAAFEADPGDVPPVFETKHGFHVMKVTDRKPGGRVTLEEVRKQVADAWAKRKGLEIYDGLYRKAKIERPE